MPKGTPLTKTQRIKLLVENHNKHINSIMLNFASQYHELVGELEAEIRNKNKEVKNE